MRQADQIDDLLRENLINWALTDIQNPIKRTTLEQLSQPNWLHVLYREELSEKIELPDYVPVRLREKEVYTPPQATLKPFRPTNEPPAFTEEKWIQALLKAMYYGLKQTYHGHFNVKKWGMRRINTTGMYVVGPMNDWGEIFFKFKVGVKNNMVYWDLENHRGKIQPKGFEGVPRVIMDAVKAQGHDFLIRKITKGFGLMLPSGAASKQALALLLELKKANIGVGNDAHGNVWAQAGKKKHYRLEWEVREEGVCWFIYDKTNGTPLDYFSTKEEIASLEMLKVCQRFTYSSKKESD